MLATLGLAVALGLPIVLPGLSPDTKALYSDTCTTIPFLLLAVVLMQRGRAGVEPSERQFWNLLSAAVGFWLAQQLFLGATYALPDTLALSLPQDLLYVTMYLFVVLALDVRPHLRLTSDERGRLVTLRRAGAVAFVIGLLTYLLVVPVAADPDSYWAGAPSFTLYVVLDGYLVLRLVGGIRAARERRWRVTYGWLLGTGASWLVLDSAEGLLWSGGLPWVDSGTAWDLFWFVPLVSLTLAGRSRWWTYPPAADDRALAWRSDEESATGSPLVVLAMLVALLHLAVYNFGVFDASTRRAHEWVAFGLLAVLGGLVFAYQRALELRNRRLEEERRAALALVEHQALHDPLTNLANRRLLWDRMGRAIAEARRRGERLALVYVDLDQFKAINDARGHTVGDETLRLVGERLAAAVRTSDTVARVGGDEFVILLLNVHDRETAVGLAEKIRTSFDRPFTVGEAEMRLGASVGVCLFPEDGSDPTQLLSAADSAMYRGKDERLGRRREEIGSPEPEGKEARPVAGEPAAQSSNG